MNININLELELNEIIGPYALGTVDGVVQTNFYVITDNKTLGGFTDAVVQLTDHTVKVAIYNGEHISARWTLQALVARRVLEDLLKGAGVSIEADLAGLWVDGYVNITPDESDLIKTLIIEKSERLLEEH